MNLHHLGWGASPEAIRAACAIAGHEPPATRDRRTPLVVEPVDYAAERSSLSRGEKRGRKPKVVQLDEYRPKPEYMAPEHEPSAKAR